MRKFVVIALALATAACAPTAKQAFGPLLVRAQTQGLPVLVYAYGVPGQISVAGSNSAVPVYVQFVVTADKPIQRVQFTLVGYSTRGNLVRGQQGLGIAVVLIGPGPFDPTKNYEVNSFHSSPAGFPGGDVACVVLAKMEILYADGRKQNYEAEALNPLLLPALRKGCGDQGPPVNFMAGG
ncbi:MAG: hypothetical protein ACRES7_01295 [Gammaproteobacteria bacterium]